MLAACAIWWNLEGPSTWFDLGEIAHKIHGGENETAMTLHLHPELVDITNAANFEALDFHMADRFVRLAPTSPLSFPWQTQDMKLVRRSGKHSSS